VTILTVTLATYSIFLKSTDRKLQEPIATFMIKYLGS